MLKLSTIFGCIIIVTLAYSVYLVENQVQNKKRELSRLNHQIKNDKETIRVLEAEWVYLNRPERLKEMASKMGLDYVAASQIKDIDSIPLRSVMISQAETGARIVK